MTIKTLSCLIQCDKMIAMKKASVHSVGVFVSHLECIYNREQDRENKFVKYIYYLTSWHFGISYILYKIYLTPNTNIGLDL